MKLNEGVSGKGNAIVDLRELPAVGENDPREAGLFVPREAGHVGVLENVRAVLVESDMRHRVADLVHQPRPFDALRGVGVGLGRGLQIERLRHGGDPRGVRGVDVVAFGEPFDRNRAAVALDRAAEEIVKDAQP